MPLLESFTVDHTIMPVPAVRKAKEMHTAHGDEITVYDLRFCQPNQAILSEKGIHTLEHLFAGFMRDHLNGAAVETSARALAREHKKQRAAVSAWYASGIFGELMVAEEEAGLPSARTACG